jgi:multicomponent Na+:H+ antiporter subunit D
MSMAAPPPWPILLIALPLLAALPAFLLPRLARWWGLATMVGILLLLGLLTPLVEPGATLSYPLGGWPAELGIGLAVDGLSLWLLWLAAVVNIAVGLYSWRYFDPAGAGAWFVPLWLLLWAALNGLLLSADLFNLYVGMELLGLAAVCLVALAGTATARRAALRYLLLNIFGSFCFLLAVVLIYRQTASLNLAIFAELGDPDPLVRLALALLSLGLIIKSALFPLHFWLPPAHASAPAPVSALLSALVVKASLYLLLRIWLPLWENSALELAALFQLFGWLGAAAVLWGSIQALRCAGVKELIAYSTVAQMGYLFLAFPLLAAPAPATAVYGLIFILAAHALAKTALFLAAGTAQRVRRQRHPEADGPLLIGDLRGLSQSLPLTAFTVALGAVILMGLPPSGGFIGKWYLLRAALAAEQWWWLIVVIGGSFLTMAYLLRPVALTFALEEERSGRGPSAAEIAALAPLRLWRACDLELPAAGSGPARCRTADRLLEWPGFILALAGIALGLFPWLILNALGGGLAASLAAGGGL